MLNPDIALWSGLRPCSHSQRASTRRSLAVRCPVQMARFFRIHLIVNLRRGGRLFPIQAYEPISDDVIPRLPPATKNYEVDESTAQREREKRQHQSEREERRKAARRQLRKSSS